MEKSTYKHNIDKDMQSLIGYNNKEYYILNLNTKFIIPTLLPLIKIVFN